MFTSTDNLTWLATGIALSAISSSAYVQKCTEHGHIEQCNTCSLIHSAKWVGRFVTLLVPRL